MKLLITTQVVDRNDPVLGFFHLWIARLAPNFSQITVICLKEGAHNLPPNVRVISLGKERGLTGSRLMLRIRYALRFIYAAIHLRRQYDAVFVHMNPEYVVLMGLLWRVWGKRIVLWYVHKGVDLKLRIANLFVHVIATASPESLRLRTTKRVTVGHGIDVSAFPKGRTFNGKLMNPNILSVGRLSPTKNQMLIIDAFARFHGFVHPRLTVVGGPATSTDHTYERDLKVRVAKHDIAERVSFLGPVTPDRMIDVYGSNDLLIHASDTGSLDKVVLEALASGMRVVSTSEAFKSGAYPILHTHKDVSAMAETMRASLESVWDAGAARAWVAKHHDLSTLVNTLSALIKGSMRKVDSAV